MNYEWGSRDGVNVYRILSYILKKYLTQQSDVFEFRKDNAGMIANLPVKMREQLNVDLSRIGASVLETKHEPEENDMELSNVFGGDSLKAADLKGSEPTLIIASVEMKKFDNGNKLVISFEGKKKTLVCNKTNANRIAYAFGSNTDNWIGQEITLFTDLVDFQGSTVEAIRIRSKKPAAKARDTNITTGKIQGDPRSDADMNDDIPF